MKYLAGLACLLFCAAPAAAQGDPGSQFVAWTPPSCSVYLIAPAYGANFAQCYESGLSNAYIWRYASAVAGAFNCRYTVVLQAWGFGSPNELYASSQAYGGPETLHYDTWIYPDGWSISFGQQGIYPC